MRPKQIKIEDILEMFKEQKVMTLSALSGKAKCSGKTILRRLKEHGYYTSYNMNGKYYTIPEIAAFDECGFWKYDDVYFNKFGGLREIMKRMIESSEMGYTVDELNKKLNVNCGSHVMTFVREGIIARRKYGGFYVYFSTDKKKQNSQAGKKEQHIRANEIPELDEYLSIRNINEKLIINVLTEFINNRKATPEEVKDILKNKNILTKKEIVDEIFRRYDLFKKKDTIEVLQEVLNLEANLKENFNFRENMGTPQIEFRSENTSCDVCGRKNHVLKTEKRNVRTTEFGEFTANETILYCPEDKYADEENKKIRGYESDKLKKIVSDNKRHGFDVMCFVGQKKFLENKRRDEILNELKSMHVDTSTGTISNLCEEFLIYMKCAHESNLDKITDMIKKEGGYVIGMDATQDGNSDILFTARDCLQGIVLCAEKMPSEASEYIKPVMEGLKEKLGNPLAIIVDMHRGEGKVCLDVFPGVPVIECNYHFLDDVGNYILSAEYTELRNALTSGMKIKSAITRTLKELQHMVIKNEYDVDQIFHAFKKKQNPEYINPDEFNISVSYLIVSWILSYRKDSNGDRFPFSLPYLDLYKRCREMYREIEKYVLFCKNTNQECEHLERLKNIVGKLFSGNKHAKRAKESARKLTVINRRFDEMRRILKMHDVGDIPRDRLTIKSDEEIGEIKKNLMQFKTKLKSKVKSGKSCDANACKIILKYLNRHEDKLFLPSKMVTVDGNEKIIRFPRTNGDEEQGFGKIKSDAIKRTGKKDVGYVLNLYGPYIAIAQNLRNEEYVKNIYGSLKDIPTVFSEVPKKEFENWKKNFYGTKAGYGPTKKMEWDDVKDIKEGLNAVIQKSNGVLTL